MAGEELQTTIEQVNQDPPPPAPSPTVEDMDDAEVTAARSAAEQDEKGQTAPAIAPAPTPAAAAPTPTAPPSPTPPAATQPASGEEIMVPKSRLDDERAKSAAKDLVLARQQGELEALKTFRPSAPAPAGAAPAAPAPVAAPTVQSLRDQQAALAARFDNGEISMKEFTQGNATIEDQLFSIREQSLAARQPTAPVYDASGDGWLEDRTKEIESGHPYTALIARREDWIYLRGIAEQQLIGEGKWRDGQKPITPTDHLLLRERIAALTDTYGPAMTGKTLAPKAAPAATPPAQQTQAERDAIARARAGKLDAAGNAPPDLNSLPTQSGGPTEFSDNAIDAMDEEQIAALPQSVRQRYLGT